MCQSSMSKTRRGVWPLPTSAAHKTVILTPTGQPPAGIRHRSWIRSPLAYGYSPRLVPKQEHRWQMNMRRDTNKTGDWPTPGQPKHKRDLSGTVGLLPKRNQHSVKETETHTYYK